MPGKYVCESMESYKNINNFLLFYFLLPFMLRICFESVVTSHVVLNILLKMTLAGGEFSFYAEKFNLKKPKCLVSI